MSKINILRSVQNILPRTNSYTPLVEVVVNAIESIEERGQEVGGRVKIQVLRSDQNNLDGPERSVEGFEVRDNGIGFTDLHREAFDTLYTDQKIDKGGRGFGRFVCLKHFHDVQIESVFRNDRDGLMYRKFSVGQRHEIIENEELGSIQSKETGTTLRLSNPREATLFDMRLDTIAKVLVQRLLPFFVDEEYECPRITLSEKDGSETILLNHYLRFISEIEQGAQNFYLPSIPSSEEFIVRTFKFFEPRSLTNQISLVAHRREVSGTPLKKYIPEFEEEFYEDTDRERKYIVKAYVFGDYLDDHVSVERGGFRFGIDPELYAPIGKRDIERNAAEIARDAIGTDFIDRAARKREHVQEYVDNNSPWLKSILAQSDLTELPWNAKPEKIHEYLEAKKVTQQWDIQEKINEIISSGNLDSSESNISEIVDKASASSKDDLVRYIAFRRLILDLFGKSLEKNDQGDYRTEGVVHDIIFPRGGDSESTLFDQHNLWLIDERLNFTTFISSDKPIGEGNLGRPDLLIYDKRVVFRGQNDESNPITIFEFKRPMRDDFTQRGFSHDPIEQIIDYVVDLRKGQCTTPKGRPVRIAENTPAYGYIVCDLTPKIQDWLSQKKSYTPMPDGQGWFN
ncbi:MAG: ATP-binding protein [Bacteroidota bacterium]|nr:ATP-binding protein [Bacteroidota bacterium]MXW13923.1 ATP-binding protein [Rhodothermaceae bacterium]MXZ17109.1 ATP-binding protein [Rhodothermaceae bacterium]MYC04399.1 ATP-binding protein [Rhodothermaceae bacterium]MYG69260.1 ATP-binding protein [Rhodothermaceae bacterium]